MASSAHPVSSTESLFANDSSKGLRILVIDDDELLLQEIQLRLEACGHEVKTANAGQQGMELLETFRPQIVLIDWMMPTMDGLEVCRRIRRLPEGKLLYLMIMTQFDNESLLVDAFEAGVDDFVIKPITPKALTARIAAGERLIHLQAEVERERRDSHRYLDTVDVMIIGLDTEGNITLANRKACDILGFSEREILGRKWFDEFVADTGDGLKWSDYIIAVKNNHKELRQYENIITIKDGAKRLVRWSNSVITHADYIVGFLSCGSDITEQRQAIEERERFSRQLVQAQKMQAIGHLVGGISHNFNNILASIIGYTELSQEVMAGRNDNSISLFLDQVHTAALEAKKFINTLQAINLEAKEEEQENTQPLLPPLLEDVARMLAPLIGSGVEVTIKADENLPAVYVNPDNLNQLLTHLCLNARDAMKGFGQITLGLCYYNYLQGICASCYNFFEGEFVALCVSDTGPGIAVEKLESIFAPFFTTKGVVSKEDGLGLPLVHGIMHSYKGHIVVDTELGKGTTFTLLFPVTRSENAQ